MARAFKILGQSNPTGNVLTNLYTVPAGNSAVVSSLIVASLNETTGTGNSFSIAVNTAGVQVSNTNYIAYRVNCPVKDTITMTLGMTLNAGSQISVNSNSAFLTFTVFGTEIY